MATQDNVIDIGIVTDASSVGRAGFGTCALADDCTMSERLRYFESATAIDEAQTAGDITAGQATGLKAALRQSPRLQRVAAIRVKFTAVAQVDTITVGGAPADGDTATITVNGVDYIYTAQSGDDVDAVATGLRAAITAGDEPVTVGGAGAVVTITANDAGTPFTAATSVTGAVTLARVTTTANVGTLAQELSAVQAEQGDWFGLGLVSRDKAHNLAAAAWVEANGKMFGAQTSDADAIAGIAGNVLETLKSSGYNATRGHWYSDDDVPFAFALLARFLAADPDIESTQADYIQLSGIPADDANITPTQRAQLAAYNAAFYLTLGGVPASGGGNKMASGRFVDTQLAVGWMRARVSETLKQLLLDFAARKSKIPFTDVGFGYIEGAVFDVLYQGVRAGHFSDTDEAGPYVNMPKRAELSQADVSARNVPFTFGAPEAGGVLTIQGTGLLSANLDLVASLAA